MKEKIGARAKKSTARAPGVSGRNPTKRDETSREFAQTSTAHIRPAVHDDNWGNETWIARSPAP